MRYPICPKCQFAMMSEGIDQDEMETFSCPDHGFRIRIGTTPFHRFIVRKRVEYLEEFETIGEA